jgi:predicted small lipoprotein YifL
MRILATLALVGLLGGCGTKGPLVMPRRDPPPASLLTAPAPTTISNDRSSPTDGIHPAP